VKYGHRIVPIELGIMSEKKGIKESLMCIDEFVQAYLRPSCAKFLSPLSSVNSDNAEQSFIAYMAQHELFNLIPDLLNDVDSNPSLCKADDGPARINVWIGTAGTRTPLHFDSLDNLFVQVAGCKYVRLYDAKETSKLYVMQNDVSYGKQGNMSSVDCEQEDFSCYPLAESARFQEVLLLPGDCLYIPSRTWHYVRAITTSASVNYWW